MEPYSSAHEKQTVVPSDPHKGWTRHLEHVVLCCWKEVDGHYSLPPIATRLVRTGLPNVYIVPPPRRPSQRGAGWTEVVKTIDGDKSRWGHYVQWLYDTEGVEFRAFRMDAREYLRSVFWKVSLPRRTDSATKQRRYRAYVAELLRRGENTCQFLNLCVDGTIPTSPLV